jgi:hypothetical protein
MFFFEKKNQKTFVSHRLCLQRVRDRKQKFFVSFFQKTSGFLPLGPAPVCAPG